MENQSDFIEFEDSDKSQIEEKKIVSVNPLTVLPTNPWVPSNRKYSKNLITKLDQEIRDFYRYIQPSKGEHDMRLFTISRLESIVKIIYGDSRVLVFGSFETKLYLPSSDLDIVIMNKSLQKPQCLFTLERALSKYNISSKIDVISKSKVFTV
jgi:non-canonical poly(A) RNA polymerase PAPD5/7